MNDVVTVAFLAGVVNASTTGIDSPFVNEFIAFERAKKQGAAST
jgi:hypothetical protein